MGVPTFRYKFARLRALVRPRGHGRRHPRAVRLLRDGGRDVHDHRAADGRADERAGRHAALGGPGRRRRGHHGAAVRVHRGRSCDRRQGRVRRRADRRDPVHAARACWAGSSSAAARRRAASDAASWPSRAARAEAAASAPNDGVAPKRILAARGIRKTFRGVQALDGVDLDVREGEILGLLGPNGSGKSTFINVVSGHYRADGGSIRFAGQDIAHCRAHRIARAGIARTYQIPRPFAHLTVLDNVALPAMFGAAALDAPRPRCAMRGAGSTSPGSPTRRSALPADLNLHQRKFLELARALASRPRLLLLDEVLSGLTPAEIDGAIPLIRAIRDAGRDHRLRRARDARRAGADRPHRRARPRRRCIAEGAPRRRDARSPTW